MYVKTQVITETTDERTGPLQGQSDRFNQRKLCVQQKRLLREINRCLAEMKNISGQYNERHVINMHVAGTPFHLLSATRLHLFIHLLRRRKSQAGSRRCQRTFEQSQPVQDDQPSTTTNIRSEILMNAYEIWWILCDLTCISHRAGGSCCWVSV